MSGGERYALKGLTVNADTESFCVKPSVRPWGRHEPPGPADGVDVIRRPA
jgi:hypothetical protein